MYLDTCGQVIISINGRGVPSSATVHALKQYAETGKRLVVLGGSGDSSFVSAVQSYFFKLGDNGYDWVQVSEGEPALAVLHPQHPLAKGLPATISQASLQHKYYNLRVGDTEVMVAARNGDGWPALLSKVMGAGGGILVYYTYAVQDTGSPQAGESVLQTILRNALTTPSPAFSQQTLRKPTLLVEAFDVDKYEPSAFSKLESVLGVNDIDVVATTTFSGQTWSVYSSIVVAMNGGSIGGSDVQAIVKYATGGARVVLIGGTGYSSYVSAISSVVKLGSTDYSWAVVGANAPALSVWHADHPLAKGLPAVVDASNSTFTRPEYMLRVGDTAARVAARNGDGYPALLSKVIGAEGGVLCLLSGC